MPLFTSAGRALSTASLFFAFALSQTCYFPDGQTMSNDVPCSSHGNPTSCCPADAFCLDNGLCYGGGLVTRASCTDATWGSEACAGYCKTESPSSAIAITPCSSDSSSNTFACGANTTDCQSNTNTFTMSGGSGLELRASQVATILQSVLSATPSATAAISQAANSSCPSQAVAPNTTGLYTSGDMAGLGCGIALPLFFALCAVFILWRRDRRRYAPPKLMYKLPDDHNEEFTFRPPTAAKREPSHYAPSFTSGAPTIAPSRSQRASFRTSFKTVGSQKPGHIPSFLERYEEMKKKGQESGREKQRHELDSSVREIPRHELGDGRVSQ